MTDHRYAVGIDSELAGTFSADPGDGVEHVGEDLGQPGLGRQAVVDGDDDDPGFGVAAGWAGGDVARVADDQRPAVNPDDRRMGARARWSVDVGAQQTLLGRFEDVSRPV